MNVTEYISSGIIELYSMHALSPAEMKEVEQMAAVHPEVSDEIKRVQESLIEYATAHALNPRPALRSEIMKAIAASSGNNKGKVIVLNTISSFNFRLLTAACIILMLISTGIIYSLYHKWQDAEVRYVSLLSEKNILTQNYNLVKNSYDRTYGDLLIMRDENSKVVTLLSTDTTKNFVARVYWNYGTHDAYIDVLSLPVPANDKQYQLWALAGGKPVDAGVFNVDTTNGGIQHLKTISNADVWAVTLEPKGGSVSPTLTQMYLLSKS